MRLRRLGAMHEFDLSDDDEAPERRLLAQADRQTSFFNARLELHDSVGRCRWVEPAGARCAETLLEDRSGAARHTRVAAGGALASEQVALVTPSVRDGVVVGSLRGVVDLHGDLMFSPALHEENMGTS